MTLGQTMQSRGGGKALALISLVSVGAVVGVWLYIGPQDPNVGDAVEMPAMMTPSTQARLGRPMYASAFQGKPSLKGVQPSLPQQAPLTCTLWEAVMGPRQATVAQASGMPFAVAASAGGVTKEDVVAVQTAWANAIKTISKVYKDGGDYIGEAGKAAGELYAYGKAPVMFKPTKAAAYPFRPTAGEAMSYFVGGKVTEGGYEEDGGFAINGGRGWSDCVYDNHAIEIKGDIAIAMGEYYFTDATDGSKNKVEYTFGYERCDDGKVRIFLHHSSVPYSR
jgi:hypothetical protein